MDPRRVRALEDPDRLVSVTLTVAAWEDLQSFADDGAAAVDSPLLERTQAAIDAALAESLD